MFTCSPQLPCNVICGISNNSCQQLTIMANNAGNLNITSLDGYKSLQFSKIYTPENGTALIYAIGNQALFGSNIIGGINGDIYILVEKGSSGNCLIR